MPKNIDKYTSHIYYICFFAQEKQHCKLIFSNAPGESAFASFDVPKDFAKASILEIVAFDQNNNAVCEWSAPIHRADQQITIDLANATKLQANEAPEIIPVGMSKIDDISWYRLADGRLYLDAHILDNERSAALTDESKW